MPILTVLLLVLSANAGAAPPEEHLIPLNLDYSRPSLTAPEWPWGWYLLPFKWAGVEVELVAEGDGKALRLRRAEDGSEAQGGYFFDWALEAGRTLGVEGRVLRPEGSAAAVRLGVLVYDDDETGEAWSAVNCQPEEPVEGSGNATCKASLTVPEGTRNVQLAVEYKGKGEATVPPLRLLVDGEAVTSPVLPGQEAPGDEDVAWVKKHAIPLATTDPSAPLDDLAPLAPLIGDAHFVLLGESTHGTREFFTLKHRVVRWLAETQGFTVFAVEDHVGAARKIDRYVQAGEGDPVKAVEELFGVWERQEMLDLVLWMRQANAAGKARMAYWGCDLQNPLDAIAELSAFAVEHDPELTAEIDAALGPMRAAWEESWYPRRAPEEHQRWAEEAKRILDRVAASAGAYRQRAGEEAAEWVLFNARLAWQAAEVAYKADSRIRDQFMAENLSWIHGHQPEGTRIVVWAHNAHVRQDEEAMGGHLARLHPGDVVSFALFTRDGGYAAYDPTERKMKTYPLFPAPRGSVEDLLRRVGPRIFALDLRGDAVAAWLRTPHYHRNIGAAPADLGFYPAPMTDGFDALFYVDRTSATSPINASPP